VTDRSPARAKIIVTINNEDHEVDGVTVVHKLDNAALTFTFDGGNDFATVTAFDEPQGGSVEEMESEEIDLVEMWERLTN
jgi:hypothetical protein